MKDELSFCVCAYNSSYPGIVELCGHNLPAIVDNWDEVANVRLKTRIKIR